MNRPENANEMRELVIDYIDALLLGDIPKAELAAPENEEDIERSAAAELTEMVKSFERLRTNEYQLLLDGVAILYKENRKSATERCYALFWEVQKNEVRNRVDGKVLCDAADAGYRHWQAVHLPIHWIFHDRRRCCDMTRRRAVKLLMAHGYSRNQAVRHFRAKPPGMCNFDWLPPRVVFSNLRRDVVIKDEAREWTRDSQRIRRLIEWGKAMYNCTEVFVGYEYR